MRYLEELTGEEVEVEEGAIAAAFKKLVDEELKSLLPIIATVQANNLPAANSLEDSELRLKACRLPHRMIASARLLPTAEHFRSRGVKCALFVSLSATGA